MLNAKIYKKFRLPAKTITHGDGIYAESLHRICCFIRYYTDGGLYLKTPQIDLCFVLPQARKKTDYIPV